MQQISYEEYRFKSNQIYICVRKIAGFAGYRLGFRRFVDCGGLESNGIFRYLMFSVVSSLRKQHGFA